VMVVMLKSMFENASQLKNVIFIGMLGRRRKPLSLNRPAVVVARNTYGATTSVVIINVALFSFCCKLFISMFGSRSVTLARDVRKYSVVLNILLFKSDATIKKKQSAKVLHSPLIMADIDPLKKLAASQRSHREID